MIQPSNESKIKFLQNVCRRAGKEIKELKWQKCIGQVVVLEWKRAGTRLYKLEMLPSYPNKKDFLDTLVHEMVHLYQMQNLGDTGNHNDLFWSFEPKVNYIGLRL